MLKTPSKGSGWTPCPGYSMVFLPCGNTLLSTARVCTAPSASLGLGTTGHAQHPAAFTPAPWGQEETRQLLTHWAPGTDIQQAPPFPAK